MINLLPPNEKRQIRARKTNVLLWRYSMVSLLLSALLFALMAVVYIIMINSKAEAEETIRTSTAKSAEYQKVQEEIAEFSENLATARTILDKEVKYSKVATRIARALPSGVVLESLSLDATTFGQPTTLNAIGSTNQDAIRLKTSLENSEYFDDVHLILVTKREASDRSTSVDITIDVIIKPEIMK